MTISKKGFETEIEICLTETDAVDFFALILRENSKSFQIAAFLPNQGYNSNSILFKISR